MDKKPRFSIIVPIYNVENYLSRCLQSLIDQTYMDIEIICVNDGSTDSSLSIVQRYAEADNRIIIIDQENKGLPAARNAGLKIAEGEYFLFVDSDDYLSEDACDVLHREIRSTGADMIVYGTEIFPKVDEEDKEHFWLISSLKILKRKLYDDPIKSFFNEGAAKPFVWNICYSSNLFYEKGLIFDEEMKYGEDMVFLFDAFPLADKVLYIPDSLYNYRCSRSDSLMAQATSKLEKKLKWHIVIIKKVLENWNNAGILTKYRKKVGMWAIDFVHYDLMKKEVDQRYSQAISRDFFNVFREYDLDKCRYNFEYRARLRDIKKLV